MNNYIRLVTQDGLTDIKFKATLAGFVDKVERPQNAKRTTRGKLDVQFGAMAASWQMVARVKYTDATYGTHAQLKTFFLLAAYPKSKIKFYDHFGVLHQVFIMGDFAPIPQVAKFDGSGSFWLCPMVLAEIDPL